MSLLIAVPKHIALARLMRLHTLYMGPSRK